jgi:hypothetical protein
MIDLLLLAVEFLNTSMVCLVRSVACQPLPQRARFQIKETLQVL